MTVRTASVGRLGRLPASTTDGSIGSFTIRATALALLLAAPALILGAVFGEDVYFHRSFNALFNEQLRAGDLYPRWLFDASAGFGAPVFYFYGCVPFYVASAFSLLGIDGAHQLALAAFVGLVASGVAAFLWARESARPDAATAAALLYMALPYHLNIDLYARFAYAEFWAFAWMPLVLAGIDRIARQRRHAWLLCAVPYALLIATHPPSTLLFSCLLVPYAACRVIAAPSALRVTMAVRMTLATALGAGMAGVYLVPALTTQGYASYAASFKPFHVNAFLPYGRLISEGTLGYAHVTGYGGPDSSRILLADAMVLSLLLVVACIAIAVVGPAARGRKLAPLLWGVVAFVALFATAEVSWPLWIRASFLQRIQFPSRVGLLIVLALVPLVAAALDRGMLKRRGRTVLWLLIGAGIASFWWPTAKDVYWGNATYGHMVELGAAIPPPEHRPAAEPVALLQTDQLVAFDRSTPRAAIVDGAGNATVAAWGPGQIRIETRSANGGTLVLHQFAYPGWEVVADPVVPIVLSTSPTGLLSIAVPPGSHRWRIARGTLDAERIGWAISAVALVIAAATLLFTRRRAAR